MFDNKIHTRDKAKMMNLKTKNMIPIIISVVAFYIIGLVVFLKKLPKTFDQ